MIRLLFICVFAIAVTSVHAQVDYQQKYSNAKSYFKDEQYNLAMEGFKSLVAYDKNNPFS